jgi:multidrug efflux pump subunit AcrB
MNAKEAMLDACHKRARPVVMTTIAMMSGLLPIVLGLSADSSFRAPMAIAVMGGLMTSTALSLLVVPVLFNIFERDSKTRQDRVRLLTRER